VLSDIQTTTCHLPWTPIPATCPMHTGTLQACAPERGVRRKVLGLLGLLPHAWLAVLQRAERNARIALDARSLKAAFKRSQPRRGGVAPNQRTALQQAEEEVQREQQQQLSDVATSSSTPQAPNAFDMWLRVTCVQAGKDRAQELRAHLTPAQPPGHLLQPAAQGPLSAQLARATRAWLRSLEASLHVGVWLHERG
jgi:hypothetical protein